MLGALDGVTLTPVQGVLQSRGEGEGPTPERFMRQRGQGECLLRDTLRQMAHLKPGSVGPENPRIAAEIWGSQGTQDFVSVPPFPNKGLTLAL